MLLYLSLETRFLIIVLMILFSLVSIVPMLMMLLVDRFDDTIYFWADTDAAVNADANADADAVNNTCCGYAIKALDRTDADAVAIE